jgi:hypothetical protein
MGREMGTIARNFPFFLLKRSLRSGPRAERSRARCSVGREGNLPDRLPSGTRGARLLIQWRNFAKKRN